MSCTKCRSDVTPIFSTQWRVVNPSSGWSKAELAEGPVNPLTTIPLEICGACLHKENRQVTLFWGIFLVICLAVTILGIVIDLPVLYIAGGVVMLIVGIGLVAHLSTQHDPNAAIDYLTRHAVEQAQAAVGPKRNLFLWNPKTRMGFVAAGTKTIRGLDGLQLLRVGYDERVLDILPLVPWSNSAVLTNKNIHSNLDGQLGGPCSLDRVMAPFVLGGGPNAVGVLYQLKGETRGTVVGWTSDASPDCFVSFISNLASILGWSIHSMKVKYNPERVDVLLSDTSCVVTALFLQNKWPQMCCVCGNPAVSATRQVYAEEHHRDPLVKVMVGTFAADVPYCESCYAQVEAGGMPGIVALHKRFGLMAVYFQSRKYAETFLALNELTLSLHFTNESSGHGHFRG